MSRGVLRRSKLQVSSVCKNGHKISSPEDLKVNKSGRTWCMACLGRKEIRQELVVGGICSEGHEINSLDDLFILKTKTLCHTCRDAKISRAPGSLLWKGSCPKGHEIRSSKDVMTEMKRGKVSAKCLHCYHERLSAKVPASLRGSVGVPEPSSNDLSEATLPRRHEVLFACSHTSFFEEPVPSRDELIYCLRCMDYQIVLRGSY